MTDTVAVVAFALALIAGIGAAVFLILRGHPWFALLVLLIVGSMRIKTGT